MKFEFNNYIICLALMSGLLLAPQTYALTYAVTQLGSLPGYYVCFRNSSNAINDSGQVAGGACYGSDQVADALQWQSGSTTPIKMGTLPGYQTSNPNSINNSGQVVGDAETSSYYQEAVLWQPGSTTPIDLGTLPGGSSSAAYDINNSGQIVGIALTSYIHAVLWQPGSTTPIDLGKLPGYSDVTPFKINNSGQVVGSASGSSSNTNAVVLWQSGSTTPIKLGTLPGYDSTSVNGLNDNGQVIGIAYDNTTTGVGLNHAVKWQPNTTTAINLGTLPGYIYSYPYDINNSGLVVGVAYTNWSAQHAVMWQSGSATPIDLGTLPGGGGTSSATGINNSGQVIGTATTSSGVYAVLWQPGSTTPIDLNTLVCMPNDVILSSANSINDLGQILVQGSDSNTYLATPISVDSNLAGSWYGQNLGASQSTVVAIFLSNGQFYVVNVGNSAGAPLFQSGIEYGTYRWDSATGVFSACDNGNTTGVPGIFNQLSNISVNGNTMQLSNGMTLTSVPEVNNSILGSWYAVNSGIGIVYTFLGNGEMYAAGVDSATGMQGISVAPYTWNSSTSKINIGALQLTTVGTDLILPGSNVITIIGSQASWINVDNVLHTVTRVRAGPSIVEPNQVYASASGLFHSRLNKTFNGTVTIDNISNSAISGPLQIVFTDKPASVTLMNATGMFNGAPYLMAVPVGANLEPGQSVTVSVRFKNPSNTKINFTPVIYSGSMS